MRQHRTTSIVVAAAALLLAAGLIAIIWGHQIALLTRGRATVADRLAQLAPVRADLESSFRAAADPFPPAGVVIVALKRERVLRVYSRRETPGAPATHRLVGEFPILAASGDLGPKLREGDRQVPEGVYRVESLNPNSRFHLSLRLNYPSDLDIQQAHADGRDPNSLGGDIMIHGGAASVGCIAIGDPAIERVFVLVAETIANGGDIEVLMSPSRSPLAEMIADTPGWVAERYRVLAARLGAINPPLRERSDARP